MKDELIKVLEEYIELLACELDELAVLASVHGWVSSRVEQGEKIRERIKEIKAKMVLCGDPDINLDEPIHYCMGCGKYHN